MKVSVEKKEARSKNWVRRKNIAVNHAGEMPG